MKIKYFYMSRGSAATPLTIPAAARLQKKLENPALRFGINRRRSDSKTHFSAPLKSHTQQRKLDGVAFYGDLS